MATKSKSVKKSKDVYTSAHLMHVLESIYSDILKRISAGEPFTYTDTFTLPITLVTLGVDRTMNSVTIDDTAKRIAMDDSGIKGHNDDFDAYVYSVLLESKNSSDREPEEYIRYLDDIIAIVISDD